MCLCVHKGVPMQMRVHTCVHVHVHAFMGSYELLVAGLRVGLHGEDAIEAVEVS